jgi:chloride channel protein, CIC family
VTQAASAKVITLRANESVGRVQAWLHGGAASCSHQGFPVLDESGRLVGVITRRDILERGGDPETPIGQLIRRGPLTVFSDISLREAADQMVEYQIGRLPVVERQRPSRLVGILTRSDILSAYRHRLEESRPGDPVIDFPICQFWRRQRPVAADGSNAERQIQQTLICRERDPRADEAV